MHLPNLPAFHAPGLWLAIGLLVGASAAAAQTTPPSWGAIAAKPGGYGYAFNERSRAAAERTARTQCERAPGGRTGACEVRAFFERSCGALATGNFGEWGTAYALTADAAGKAAIAQCDSHLPTEPCKLAISVCSLR